MWIVRTFCNLTNKDFAMNIFFWLNTMPLFAIGLKFCTQQDRHAIRYGLFLFPETRTKTRTKASLSYFERILTHSQVKMKRFPIAIYYRKI